MPVEAAMIEQLRLMVPAISDTDEMLSLVTTAEVIGFVASTARTEGRSEADDVELVVRAAGLGPDDVRQVERTLRALGYRSVAERLKQIAGRRIRSLAPLS